MNKAPKLSLYFYNKALNIYLKKSLEVDFIDLLLNIAVTLDSLGKQQDAVKTYKKVLEINPHEARAYYGLAIIYDDRKEFDKAIEMYKKAIEINPDYSKAYFFLANSCDEGGRKEEAAEYFDRALKIKTRDLNKVKGYDFEYDVAISYAGENRRIVEQIAKKLTENGIRVFYDIFEKSKLWGKKLSTNFRFVIILFYPLLPLEHNLCLTITFQNPNLVQPNN
jgi:tetratricopeptide (TPR) repeat protein